MEWMITADQPGKTVLLQGNEAMARGALEAGISFAAAYPGSPSSEILTMLGHVAEQMDLYTEWSANETCALEACMGASFAGVRALCVMKQNGLLVVGDALHTAALSGCKGGVVLVVADDPDAHSSTNEFDSRHLIKSADLPMLEPSTFQEARDMVRWGFELSERLEQVVVIRSVTRICHGRGNVTLGELPGEKKSPRSIGEWDRMIAINWFHQAMLTKLDEAYKIYEQSDFNQYSGPEQPDLLIVTSGTGWLYSIEAAEKLKLEKTVGILKLGCTWPLPEKLILDRISKTSRVLVIEEVDPFLEDNLAALIGRSGMGGIELYGRQGSGVLPRVGEMNPDLVIKALALLQKCDFERPRPNPVAEPLVIPPRELTFCAGCPHRASFFLLKEALGLQEGNGVVMGDIGCYTMGGQKAGHYLLSALGCMGGGINMAEGLGQLSSLGFNQPVVALAGDSTFFHSCLPGLVNARYHNANMLFVILDNSATAMTGFQPHPGIGINAMGKPAQAVNIEKVVQAIGCPTWITDPYDINTSAELVYDLLKKPGLKVLIMRQACATLTARSRVKPRVYVDVDLCRGDGCGCGRFCSRIWGCPGNIWNEKEGKASIDEIVCVGCGVCAALCPAGAIKVEGGRRTWILI